MSYAAHITDTTTNETRILDFDGDWTENMGYLWAEGNYGCDCNRHLFFERAVGHESYDHEGCSLTRFTVKITVDGTAVYGDVG